MKPFIKGTILPTTVVGSFPAIVPTGMKRLFGDPLFYAAKNAVARQIQAGITIISDGQVRGDMIETFSSRLPGCRGREVIGPVRPSDSLVMIKDTKYALSQHPHVKGIITGPTTISYGLSLSTATYRNKNELIPDIASALIPQAQALARLGVSMIQIDEPLFSTGAADLSLGRDALVSITSGLSLPVCLHVCGDITHIIDDIIQMPADIIDVEGTDNPEILTVLSKKDIAKRWIGYGCVSSADSGIEKVSLIEKRIRNAVELCSPEQILLDPDCGLRMLTPDIAFEKLRTLGIAANTVRNELTPDMY